MLRRLTKAPRRLDPLLEKRLIKAMIGVTCDEERFELRQWLLGVNAIVQKRANRSIFDLDARQWKGEFLTGMSAEAMASILLDQMPEDDDPRLQAERYDDYRHDSPYRPNREPFASDRDARWYADDRASLCDAYER
jgi:hypothetical protein